MAKAKRDTKVLATYNIKGGVGKTSAAVNLAYLAARDGHSTLLWDLDPQAASTYLFRVRPKVKGGGHGLLRKRSRTADHIKATDHERLDLLPADFSYRHLDLALDQFKKPAARLRKVLEPLLKDYDYIFLDCPPSISLVSESVFEAADALLVPVIPATLSSRSYEQLDELSRRGRVGKIGGTEILSFFSMAEVLRPLHLQVMERLRNAEQLKILGAAIPVADEVEMMGEERNPVGIFAPASAAAVAYQALWVEIEARLRPGLAGRGSHAPVVDGAAAVDTAQAMATEPAGAMATGPAVAMAAEPAVAMAAEPAVAMAAEPAVAMAAEPAVAMAAEPAVAMAAEPAVAMAAEPAGMAEVELTR